MTLWLLNTAYYLLSFALIISVVVFVHEFGHYFVARLCGVRIEVFSIGFGPELVGWTDRHGTRWKISAFPLGGYVKMFGDETAASTPSGELQAMSPEELKQTFHGKKLPAKAAIVLAGPLFNFLLAIGILTYAFTANGYPFSLPVAGEILAESAAEKAGIQTGDRILSMDGQEIESFSDLQRIVIARPGQAIPVKIQRGDQELALTVTPELKESKDIFGNVVRVGRIGIKSGKLEMIPKPLPQAFTAAVKETYVMSRDSLVSLWEILTGKRGTEDLGGVVRIAHYSGQSIEQGLDTVLHFLIMLSIGLGVFNLLPVPMLDGGHLAFYTFEAIFRRPLPQRVQDIGFRIGMALLIALMAFTTFNDFKQLKFF